MQASRCPLPVELMGICLILLVALCENTCKVLPAKEVHPSLSVQGFYWAGGGGSCHAGMLCYVSDLSDSDLSPQSKTGAHHKSHC